MTELREMRSDESRQVLQVMRRCFPVLMRLFLSVKGTVFLLCEDNEIIAGTVLQVITHRRGRRTGIVSWIFTTPQARGKGAAGMLLDRALQFFQDQGCCEVTAIIEGYNTPSSNRFAERGFTMLSAADQVRCFGVSLPKILLSTLHYFDIGHFLWYRGSFTKAEGSFSIPGIVQWLFTVLWISGIMSLLYGFPWVSASAAVLLILLVRQVAVITAWKMLCREPAVYRCWGTGTFLSGMIALVFRGLVPAVGGLYPAEQSWSMKKYLRVLGISSAAGSLAVMAVAVMLRTAVPLSPFSAAAGALLFTLIVFDNFLPFFPFSCFLSGRILAYSRKLYGLTAVLSAVVLYLLYFF